MSLPTDVVGGPDKRFLLAGVSKEGALVAYEWGKGWERGFDAAAYVLAGADWHLTQCTIELWRCESMLISTPAARQATARVGFLRYGDVPLSNVPKTNGTGLRSNQDARRIRRCKHLGAVRSAWVNRLPVDSAFERFRLGAHTLHLPVPALGQDCAPGS